MSARHATILIVEDNDICREEWTNILCTEGYEVVPLRHGQEALDYLQNNPAPDLILLDMLLPVLDGWHFLKRLPKPVPIIITTGTVLTREWAASYGCAGCLRKPIEAVDLLAEVRCCLG
jgi:two-component system, chemotaxis family, chemotaxis protein CheY